LDFIPEHEIVAEVTINARIFVDAIYDYLQEQYLQNGKIGCMPMD